MARQSDTLTFAGVTISRRELLDAIRRPEPRRRREEVEQKGKDLALNLTPAASRAFSKAVCDWALTGGRVWGNLKRHHGNRLGTKLRNWFKVVLATDDVGKALKRGRKIKGLDVSFASKHLRMLQPDRFAVLDSVLSRELGFALNKAGYAFFLRELQAFRQCYDLQEYTIGTLESGLFKIIRDRARSQD